MIPPGRDRAVDPHLFQRGDWLFVYLAVACCVAIVLAAALFAVGVL